MQDITSSDIYIRHRAVLEPAMARVAPGDRFGERPAQTA